MEATETNLRGALREDNRRSSDFQSALAVNGFMVRETIGRGAFSEVKRAYDMKRKKFVAIKIISKANIKASLINKYMPRELDIIKDLHHNQIIKYYEYIETTMRFYIIMQYAEKGPLMAVVMQNTRLSEAMTWDYFGQLTDAVQYIHNAGIAHRDIKCENIVLDANDKVKLIDFGFACRVRVAADTTGSRLVQPHLSKTFCGSHSYASPELLRCKPYDPLPCDIWATGVVLYIMLFGRLPFSNSRDIPVLLERISKGLSIPADVTLSEEVIVLLDEIFVPVLKRPNIAQLRKSAWMRIAPRKTKSNGKSENNPESNKGPESKRLKFDNI